MRLTSKGQVTIPIDIRDRLGLQPGTEIEFEVDGETVRLRRAASGHGRGRAIVERLRGRGDIPLSTEDIMALTRGE